MKKWLLVVSVIFLLLLAGIYVFIPSKLTIAEASKINCSVNGTNRFLMKDSNWVKWWPANNTEAKVKNQVFSLVYNGFAYKPADKFYNRRTVLATKNDVTINSSINVLPVSIDTMQVLWQADMETGISPAKRVKRYLLARRIKKNMQEIMPRFKTFLEKTENVYGYNIERSTIKKTYLAATISTFDHYPSTIEIYSLINKLKQFVAANKAVATNHPMVNITNIGSNRFEAMIGLPTDKELAGKGDVLIKRIVTEKVLATRIKGGTYQINNALAWMEIYLNDYHLFSPAIPFQSLVTDRLSEPDSSKWITDIFYPLL